MILSELPVVFRKTMAGGQVIGFVLAKVDESAFGFAQPGRRLDQSVENRLQVERRAADDLENIGGGGLLLERLTQLLQQTRIFDRDHRLVGKRLHQLDLPGAERARFSTLQGEDADNGPLPHQRHGQPRAHADKVLQPRTVIFGVSHHVRNVHRAAFEYCAPENRAAIRLRRVLFEMLALLLGQAERRDEGIAVGFAPPDNAGIRLAQHGRRTNEGVEHRPQIKSRPADDLEHVGRGGLLLQRLAQVVGAGLYFVKQPYVLDRDYRLVGEGG